MDFKGKRSKRQQYYVLVLWCNNILILHYVFLEFSEVVTVVFVFLAPLIDILLISGEVKAKYILTFYSLMLHTHLFSESCLGPDLLNCRCCAATKEN